MHFNISVIAGELGNWRVIRKTRFCWIYEKPVSKAFSLKLALISLFSSELVPFLFSPPPYNSHHGQSVSLQQARNSSARRPHSLRVAHSPREIGFFLLPFAGTALGSDGPAASSEHSNGAGAIQPPMRTDQSSYFGSAAVLSVLAIPYIRCSGEVAVPGTAVCCP